MQKRLNRSICRLGCELGWAEGSISSIIFARWRQCAQMGGHIVATWRIRLSHPSAAAMRSYVKLLLPLVVIIKVSAVVVDVSGTGTRCWRCSIHALSSFCCRMCRVFVNVNLRGLDTLTFDLIMCVFVVIY